MMWLKFKLSAAVAVLCAPADGAGGDAGGASPNLRTKADIDAYVGEMLGKQVSEAIKKGMEEAREKADLPSSKEFTLSPNDIMRAGSVGSEDKTTGVLTSKYLGWMVRGNMNPEKAYQIAKRAGADVAILRALGESTIAGGGAFAPQQISSDYIKLLYANSVFLAAGPTRMPVPNGNLTVPKVATGAASAWVGESVNIAKSEATFSQLRLDLKKLAVVTAISNEALYDSNPALDVIARDDLVNNSAVVVDTAFLRSPGSAFQPRGLKSLVAAANSFHANATSNIANVTTDLTKMARLLEDAKIRFIKPAWFMSPTERWGLMAARDGQGKLVWAEEMAAGKLYGMPFYVTQNIPANLGGSTNQSELYLVDMAHMLVGDDPRGVMISMQDGAAYFDGSTVQPGFTRDESVLKLVLRTDLIARQSGNEIAFLDQVNYNVITAT